MRILGISLLVILSGCVTFQSYKGPVKSEPFIEEFPGAMPESKEAMKAMSENINYFDMGMDKIYHVINPTKQTLQIAYTCNSIDDHTVNAPPGQYLIGLTKAMVRNAYNPTCFITSWIVVRF